MEVWKSIKEFKNYEVSNFGNVRNAKRNFKLLKLCLNHKGYCTVKLYKKTSKGLYWKSFVVHRLVAIAFIPNPQKKPQVNHINAIKTNNFVENLEWNTAKENVKHSIDFNLRTSKIGEESYSAKFTNKQAEQIRQEFYLTKNLIKDFAKKYNVSSNTMSNLLRGKIYV